MQLAIDQANDAGRLDGVELAVKAYDTGATTTSTIQLGARPPYEDGERFSDDCRHRPVQSFVAESTIPITNQAGLLECSPSNSDSSLTKPEHGALELRVGTPGAHQLRPALPN